MKVNIGQSAHNARKFPHQSVDVNSTSDFGFMQPMCGCIELAPKSTLVVQHRGFVRLHAMVAPTFGRVSERCYHYFVPIPDIWHPFESFLAGQPYNGVSGSYIPTKVPSISPLILQSFLTKYCYATTYQADIDLSNRTFKNLVRIDNDASIINNLISTINSQTGISSSYFEQSSFTIFPNIVLSTPEDADIIWINENKLICCKLSNQGRNLRKVFVGLGYKPSFQRYEVSLLPLFAFYKAYFDFWYPKRDITWKNTSAFNFLEVCEQYNLTSMSDFVSQGVDVKLYDFIDSLTKCYYYQNPDYFSSQFVGQVNNNERDVINIPLDNGTRYGLGQVDSVSIPNINAKKNISAQSAQITTPRLKALQFLTKYVNKKSIIGGKIDTFLRAIFGADYIQEDNSYFIGEDSFSVELSEVMSNAGTTETLLGEYAGQGKGYNSGKKFKVHSTTFGYYINMVCVIPLSRFNQGSNPNLNHISKFDFYHPDVDGITLVPTPKSSLLSEEFVQDGALGDVSSSFGFAPIYQEYKMIAQNILNGDMSLNSTRDTYRPYQLDKELPISRYYRSDSQQNYKSNKPYNQSDLVASVNWRSIGLYRALGNFNRIFYSAEGQFDPNTLSSEFDIIDDPIICQNIFEYDFILPMLPYADSYDTDGFEDALSVEHS